MESIERLRDAVEACRATHPDGDVEWEGAALLDAAGDVLDATEPRTSKQLARVSTLLDQAVEALEGEDPTFNAIARSAALIREAQGILLGERPVHPEEN